MKNNLLRQFIMLSKLTFYGIFLQCLFIGVLLASSSEAQKVKKVHDVYVTLDGSEFAIKKIFEKIEENSDFEFSYYVKGFDPKRKIKTMNGKIPVSEVLMQISKEAGVSFRQINNVINVRKSEGHGIGTSVEIVLADVDISGKITDENGQGLPGASVIQKGTANGTTTDLDGNYKLSVSDQSILSISFVGYQTSEIIVGTQRVIDFQMELDASQLDEIVVVGYGTSKKSDVTGSLVSVSSEDFDKQPIIRLDQALQGRAAGVQVTQTGGGPGAGYKVRIRGANSISGSNVPLYVVDGFITSSGNISSINASDIQSMEVLKDASATAIYGSRGANGVIIITTKTGRRGKSEINFNAFHSFSNVIKSLPVMTASEYAEGVNFAEGIEFFTPQEIEDLKTNAPESWHDRLFNQANTSNYVLSSSGGSDNMDYYISGSYHTADGTLINQSYDRYTIKANLNADLTERTKVGLRVNGRRTKSAGRRASLVQALTWDPTTPMYNIDGDYNFSTDKPGVGNGFTNPFIHPNENVEDKFNNDIIVNGFIDIELAKGLTFNVYGGMEWANQKSGTYNSIMLSPGQAVVSGSDTYRYLNTNRLTYKPAIDGDHTLQVDAIHEQYLSTYSQYRSEAEGFFSDNTTYKKLSLGQIQQTSNFANDQSLQSFLGRVNYGFKGKYLFTASLRADGSSKFREGNRWGVFPSGSVAWRMSEEAFIQSISVIDNLKLRVSYGITGSQAVGPLRTWEQPIIDPGVNYPFSGGTATVGVAPSNRLANPDLSWEETKQGNIGLDIGLWSSKVTLSVDVYKKHTYNLLLDRILPEFLGTTVVTENVGEVENKGFEINLGLTPISTKDWNVTSIFTLSKNQNKVLALVSDEPIELGNSGLLGGGDIRPTHVEVGKSISSFRGYKFLGVYQTGEESEAAIYGKQPGDAKYLDVNEDGIISPDDVIGIGDGNPDFTYGWNNTVSWRKFDVNILFIGSHGNDIYNIQRGRMMALGATTFHASHADYNDHWTTENPSNIPSGRDGTELASSQFVEGGSFLALKNVSLSYTFSENNVLDRIGLSSARLYTSIENAFIMTNYSGYDPETTAQGTSDIDVGIDTNAYPLSRKITLGLNLTF